MPLIDRSNTCCFTGHRPEKLPWRFQENDPQCISLKNKIYDIAKSVYHSGARHFICGMAQGCDTYFCEALIALRDEQPDITIEAAIPCESQAQSWSEAARSRYFRLIGRCDLETLVSREYTRNCMFIRNKYMIDNSSYLIAVFDGTLGGTMQTINYARKSGIEIIEIKPY